MLDLNSDATDYLSAPAERSRWQDTWTMQRTRREAMARLARSYGSWKRTLFGVLATVILLGGSYLLGIGFAALSEAGGPLAAVLMTAAVLALLVGLVAGGFVLFAGSRVVHALRVWSTVRANDGGPGAGVALTPAVVVRGVLAVLALAGGVVLVLVRVDVLAWFFEPAEGDALWQWFAAACAIVCGAVVLVGLARVLSAVRRPSVPGAKSSAQWQPAGGSPQQGSSLPAPTGVASLPPGGGLGTAPLDDATFVPQPHAGSPWQPQAASDTYVPESATDSSFVPQPGADESFVPQPGADATFVPQPEGEETFVPPAQAEESFVPQPAPASADQEWAATRMVRDLPKRPTGIRAVLPDGRSISTDGITLLGRSPAPGATETIVATFAVDDRGVSKTHLAVRINEGQAWVTDRASTNGTLLLRGEASEALTAWQEVQVSVGDRLVLGTTTVQIDTAPGA